MSGPRRRGRHPSIVERDYSVARLAEERRRTTRDIAVELGLSLSQVQHALKRMGVKLRTGESRVQHGTNARYAYGCRCDTCCQAKAVANRYAHIERKRMALYTRDEDTADEEPVSEPVFHHLEVRCPRCPRHPFLVFGTDEIGRSLFGCWTCGYRVSLSETRRSA